ncbi:hypothetical protein NW762_008603 [Fusarium torreyae]|uniref:Gfd2/YDR514C-like C-terminal domain-containing protein n=1 Tax=Fusarium torreyae TaxID=1237075 RepID=A0A9W8RX38_9HYPO|nr:hypothetical protein NW762_008603 [Fusarium torreyae]
MGSESTAVEPAHKGILRDDTIVLRWILGYCGEAQLSNASLPKAPSAWPCVPLTSSPSGSNSQIKRLRFVSIDIDKLEEKDGIIQRFHMGLSFLDAQCLQNLLFETRLPAPDTNLASHVIRSHHWAVGSYKHFTANDIKFLFGKAQAISLSDLEARLRGFVQQAFVLVFHGGKQELSVLQKLNINLGSTFTIDTVKAAQHPLQLSYRYSLQLLLDEFKIPHRQLHTAGNDAHFALRALLMIAVRDAESQLAGKHLPDWVSILKAVAQAPLPPVTLTKREKAAKAKKERQQRLEEQMMEEYKKKKESGHSNQ